MEIRPILWSLVKVAYFTGQMFTLVFVPLALCQILVKCKFECFFGVVSAEHVACYVGHKFWIYSAVWDYNYYHFSLFEYIQCFFRLQIFPFLPKLQIFSFFFFLIFPSVFEWSSYKFDVLKISYQESWRQGRLILGVEGGEVTQLATFRSLAPTHRDKLEGAGGPRWQVEKGSIICSAIAAWDIFQNVTNSPQERKGAGQITLHSA